MQIQVESSANCFLMISSNCCVKVHKQVSGKFPICFGQKNIQKNWGGDNMPRMGWEGEKWRKKGAMTTATKIYTFFKASVNSG